MMASTPYGAGATVMCLPRSAARRLYYIDIPASMTGWARSPVHTASDHATTPHILVSCSLWAILSQLTIARRSSSGEGGGRPAAARHPCATGTSLIVWAHTVVVELTLCATRTVMVSSDLPFLLKPPSACLPRGTPPDGIP